MKISLSSPTAPFLGNVSRLSIRRELVVGIPTMHPSGSRRSTPVMSRLRHAVLTLTSSCVCVQQAFIHHSLKGVWLTRSSQPIHVDVCPAADTLHTLALDCINLTLLFACVTVSDRGHRCFRTHVCTSTPVLRTTCTPCVDHSLWAPTPRRTVRSERGKLSDCGRRKTIRS